MTTATDYKIWDFSDVNDMTQWSIRKWVSSDEQTTFYVTCKDATTHAYEVFTNYMPRNLAFQFESQFPFLSMKRRGNLFSCEGITYNASDIQDLFNMTKSVETKKTCA